MDPDELAANQFNPNGDKKLSQFHELLNAPVQRDRNDTDKTYQGRKNRTAWARFQDFGKNKLKETKTEDKKTWDTQSWGMFEIDPLILMPKLKNMARMVNDYPELQGNIGTLERLRTPGLQRNDVPGGGQSKPDPEGQAASGEPKETTYMQTSTTSLYADEADEYKNLDRFKNNMDAYYRMSAFPLRMNADADADTDEMRTRRMNTDERTMRTHSLTQRLEYAGNHEMGHMLNFLLYKEMNRKKKDRNQLNNEDHRYDITANKLVDKALKRSMSKEEYDNLVRYQEDNDDKSKGPKHKKGQINLQASGVAGYEGNPGHTSQYGATDAGEFFAEAFADVYQNGNKARKASIELVKLYEKNMKYFKDKNAGKKWKLTDQDREDLLLD